MCYILIFAEIRSVSLIWCVLCLDLSLDKSLCAQLCLFCGVLSHLSKIYYYFCAGLGVLTYYLLFVVVPL